MRTAVAGPFAGARFDAIPPYLFVVQCVLLSYHIVVQGYRAHYRSYCSGSVIIHRSIVQCVAHVEAVCAECIIAIIAIDCIIVSLYPVDFVLPFYLHFTQFSGSTSRYCT